MLHTWEVVVLTPQLRTEVQHVHQEVLMVVMEPQDMEGSMGMHQGVLPVGLMEVMGDSLMEHLMDTTLQQVTSPLVLTLRRTSGSRVLTRTTAASSTLRS